MANYKVKKKKLREARKEKEEMRKFFLYVGIAVVVFLILMYLWYQNM